MKILLYSHFFAPGLGGVETFSARLASELPAALSEDPTCSCELTVVTQTPGTDGSQPEAKAPRVIRGPGIWGLWRLVGKSDVVLLAGPALLPILFGLLQSKTVVVTHHGYQTVCPNGLLFHLPTQSCCPGHFQARNYLECVRCCARESGYFAGAFRVMLTFPRRALCRLVWKNVSVSEHLNRRLQLPSSVVVRNGVPLTTAPVLAWKPIDSPTRFLFVGRMVAEKGVRVLIEAAGILRNRGHEFRLLLAGDGPERAALEQLSRELGLQEEVCFVGFKTGKELQELLEEPSISVIPSICEDVAPFAPLEQMMTGKAIIASDIGGLAEEVGNAGLTYRPADAEALSRRMQELIRHPSAAFFLGKAARERVACEYSTNQMISGYVNLLKSLRRES